MTEKKKEELITQIDSLKKEIEVNCKKDKGKLDEKCWISFEKFVREALHDPIHRKTGLHVLERMTQLKVIKSDYKTKFKSWLEQTKRILEAGYNEDETIYQLETLSTTISLYYSTTIAEINSLTYFILDNER